MHCITFAIALVSSWMTSCEALSPYYISTFAGNGAYSSSDDGVVAQSSPIYGASGVWSSTTDIFYYTENSAKVRLVSVAGILGTLAGGGVSNPVSGIVATSASFSNPYGIWGSGNTIYMSDSSSYRIWCITNGIITLFAGNGNSVYSGDGVGATSSAIYSPFGVCGDSSGKIYIAAYYAYRIFKVSNSVIGTVGGSGILGYSSDGAAATASSLGYPYALFSDSSGNIYVSESYFRIRNIATNGIISTFVGTGSSAPAIDGLPATSTTLYGLCKGIWIDSTGIMFYSDYSAGKVKAVTSAGAIVSTIAGTGSHGLSGNYASATAALLFYPSSLFGTSSSTIYLYDNINYMIRALTSTVPPTPLPSRAPTAVPSTSFSPTQLPSWSRIPTVGPSVTPTYTPVVAPSFYMINAFAGSSSYGSTGDNGPATSATFPSPYDYWYVFCDTQGVVYISDGNYRVRKVSVTGIISNFMGIENGVIFSGDGGPATSANNYWNLGVWGDSMGRIYISSSNYRIRKVDASGIISTFAGTGYSGVGGDGSSATSAIFGTVYAISGDSSGSVYFVDYDEYYLRKIDSAGIISTVAGTGLYGSSGDGGPATASSFRYCYGIAVDSLGSLFFSDTMKVRSISNSQISTAAGTSSSGFSGDGTSATASKFSTVLFLYRESTGTLHISDPGNKRMRMISANTVYTVAGTGVSGLSSTNTLATSSTLNYINGISGDTSGNLYFTEVNIVRKLTAVVPTVNPTYFPTAPTLSPTIVPTLGPTASPSTRTPTTTPSAVPTTSIPTTVPSVFPSILPTLGPTELPTFKPTTVPTLMPTLIPSNCPSVLPSVIPSIPPSVPPYNIPSVPPTVVPSCAPTQGPSIVPSLAPSNGPSVAPSAVPTLIPSLVPTVAPSCLPTNLPSVGPSAMPTIVPSLLPSIVPTVTPKVLPTVCPTAVPTAIPTVVPTVAPSNLPTGVPTVIPTGTPTVAPSMAPTFIPTVVPSVCPSTRPTEHPTQMPSLTPSEVPTEVPTIDPTAGPTVEPSVWPSVVPSLVPTEQPTVVPTEIPTASPTELPSIVPTELPTELPTEHPTNEPTVSPSIMPSVAPTETPSNEPSVAPSLAPTRLPSETPSVVPSQIPSNLPSVTPTMVPTLLPSVLPSQAPNVSPSSIPSVEPTLHPSQVPSLTPSDSPSANPSRVPTLGPSQAPSVIPSVCPSLKPTDAPSFSPSLLPTTKPTLTPSAITTAAPTATPTFVPTTKPTVSPTLFPSLLPTVAPSRLPTASPSLSPSARPTRVPTATPTALPTAFSSDAGNRPSQSPTLAPTVSSRSMWTSALQSALIDVSSNASSSVVHQWNYNELYVSEDGPQNVYGSSSKWVAQIAGDLTMSSRSFKITGLQMTAQDSLSGSVSVAGCSDASKTLALLSALTSPSVPSTSVTCSGRVWQVKSCSGSGAVCVDCSDPCSTQSHCAGSSAYSLFSLAPAVSQSCSSAAQRVSQFRVVSVSFANLQSPPSIVLKTVDVIRTSITATVTLSSAGTVYCGVFTNHQPSSVDEVIVQNFAAVTQSPSNTSVVTVTGLSAITSYTLYCMSASTIGVKMSTTDMLSSALTVTTACCKTISVSLSATSISENQGVSNLLSFSLSGLPSSSVQVSLVLTNDATGQVVSSSLYPTSFSFASVQASLTGQASLFPLSVGTYTVSLQRSGPSSGEYEVVYASRALTVLSADAPLPAPVLSSAVFSGDGSYVSVKFDSNTDKAGATGSFSCSRLLSFECAAVSKCQWVDSSTVTVYGGNFVSSQSCFLPGSSVSVTPTAGLKAACGSAVCVSHSTWQNASSSVVVTLQAPVTPVTPTVVITAPSVVGLCDSLTLDVSSSYGNGGRDWLNSSIVVHTLDGSNVSALQHFLDTRYTVSPPTAVPAGYLVTGVTYSFVVTLCNFLQSCGQASAKVIAVDTSPPVVSLPGSALRSTSRSASLSISSLASVTSCGSLVTSSNLGLTYSWSVSTSGIQVLTLASSSRDPSKLLLPAYSLASSVVYSMTLTVSSRTSSVSATASVSVVVTQGSVIARIVGGSAVRIGDSLALSGASSYDEDVQGLTGFDAGLSFAWSCQQMAPVFSETCSSLLQGSFADQSSISLTGLAAGSGQVVLTVFDSSLQRTAQSAVTVTVMPSTAAVVGLVSNQASGVMNAGQVLQLTGSVALPSGVSGNVTWSVSSSYAFSLSSAAQSALTVSLPASDSTAARSLFMAFAANSLPVGATLVFSLNCLVSGSVTSSQAHVTVLINAPPQPGSFLVSPASVIASRWVDSDLPISYQFGYTSASGSFVSLVSPSQKTFTSLSLAAGLASENYRVDCVAQIFDSLNANTSAFYSVSVQPGAPMTAEESSSVVNATLFGGSGSADGIKQSAALVSYLLNSVDCSAAPDCSSLNRQNCFKTPNTCGSCVSDGFIGQFGDANSKCVAGSEVVLGPVGGQCEGPLQCLNSFASCVSGQCVLPSKQCPSDCSGHGRCVFVDAYSNETLASCSILDDSCKAVCLCETEYSLSVWCEATNSEKEFNVASRSLLLESVAALAALEDPTEQSLTGLMTALSSATQNVAELSVSALTSALGTSSAVLQSVVSVGLSAQASSGLLVALDFIGSAVSSSSSGGSGRRRLSSDESAAGVAQLQSLLQQYGAYVTSTLLPGQNAVTSTQSSFQLSSQYLSSSTASGLSLPQTTLQSISGAATSSVGLPAGSTASALTIISLGSQLYGNLGSGFNSNPLTVLMSALPCGHSTGACSVTVTLQNNYDVSLSALKAQNPEYFNTSCFKGHRSVLNHTCLNGQVVHNITCSGRSDYIIRSRCPEPVYSQVCNSLSGTDVSAESGCTLVPQTDSGVTCSCSVSSFAGSSRRVLTASGNDSEYSASYVAMLSSTARTFADTFESAGGLNNATVEKGWEVLVTIGVFAGAILAALYAGHRADKQIAKDKHASLLSKLTKKTFAVAPTVRSVRIPRDKLKNKKGVNSDLSLVEQSLPKVLSVTTSMSEKVMNEIKQHHRWLGVVFYFSDSFPRVMRVASLATNVIIMLFIQSITYNITNPDDGSCEALNTPSSCIAPRSSFATGESKCRWDSVHDSCSFIQPSGSMKIVLFVAIFSAIVSTPIALTADWIMHHIVSAPIVKAETVVPAPIGNGARESIREPEPSKGSPKWSSVKHAVRHTRVHTMTADYQLELTQLANDVREYREGLTSQQRIEFDLLWGLDENGCFKSTEDSKGVWRRLFGKSKETVNVHQAVLADLKAVDQALAAELKKHPADDKADDSPLTETERRARRDVGRRLLFLFQCDLLPGVSGQILQSKGSRDSVTVAPVSRSANMAGCVALAALNIGMLFYILLFALRQTSQRQSAWFQSFILWLIVEILIVSTCIVLFTHIFIPMIAMKDVTKIKQRLLDSIRDFHLSVANKVEQSENKPVFNAAKYLFVSTRLAQCHPFVKEAAIILRFSTPWPKQSYQHYSDVSKSYSKKFSSISRSVSIIVMFFLTNLLNVPPSLQDMVIHMVTTTSVGYTILLHLELFHIFPLLVVGPFLCLCVIAHFVIQAGKAGAKKRLAQLLPVRENTPQSDNATQSPGSVSTTAAVHVTRRQSVMQGMGVVKDLKQLRRNYVIAEEDSEVSIDDDEDEVRSEDVEAIMRQLNADTDSEAAAGSKEEFDYPYDVPIAHWEYDANYPHQYYSTDAADYLHESEGDVNHWQHDNQCNRWVYDPHEECGNGIADGGWDADLHYSYNELEKIIDQEQLYGDYYNDSREMKEKIDEVENYNDDTGFRSECDD